MTIIAGIVSRTDRPLDESSCASLAQLISRNPDDEVRVFKDDRSYFAKTDIKAFGEPAFFMDADGAISFLAGEPLLANSKTSGLDRHQDLLEIHEQCLKGNWEIFREANGTFSIVHHQPQSGTLCLIADKLGVRPLYFWLDDGLVVFANALRVFENLSLVPKKIDLRAVTEIVGLGAPLADRTPYAGISMLKAGQMVRITREKASRSYYWRWDEIETAQDSESLRLNTVYDHFQEAVSRRIRIDSVTTAYLSGGLDSRCVVAALRDNGVQVHTVNFARPGTQDWLFGNSFAEKVGALHKSLPKKPGDDVPDYSSLMSKALEDSNYSHHRPAERPRLVWSGEGGSVLLGMVHLSPSIVELMRAGNIDGAIEEYLKREQIEIADWFLRPNIRGKLRDAIKQGIRQELDELNSKDAARNFYLFLMHNDQRRKLIGHFEDIDLHRLEFQLPFFDASFLASVIRTPLDLCLRHSFYLKWLDHFPSAVTAVPWQAYPEHEPCPLAAPTNLAHQWDDDYQASEYASRKKLEKRQASELLRSINFPNMILSKRNLRLALWIHSTGRRDYQYAFKAARTYRTYATKCAGQFTFSDL